MIGHIFAQRYQLEEFIGKGGMALVFRAKDLRTGHNVAVKILKPEYSEDAEYLDRFSHEALAASKVSHHNIVNLLDMGHEDGFHYLVMEYMHGRTLKEIISERGKLSEQVAAQVIIRVLSALQHAHENGIIHRDIKPQNILVNSEGMIKVSDFGIARVAGTKTLTKGDQVMGSVYYISPEQAKGEDVTRASDIYSAGVVLYEMLTGRVPFDGDTAVAIAMQHISAQPPLPTSIVPEISPAMEQVVLKAISKDPGTRFKDAAAMALAIRAALEQPGMTLDSTVSLLNTNTSTKDSENGHINGNAKKKKKKTKERILIIALTFVILGVLTIGTYGIVTKIANSVEAPYLVGETEESAVRIGTEAGLTVKVVRQSDSQTPAGTVILQSRAYQYQMKRGDVIVITVSTGPEKQGVPDLKGKTLTQAQSEAEKYGFKVLVTGSVASDQPYSTILTQTPNGGEMLAYGEIIQVEISGSVTVPNVTDKTLEQAMTLLQESGLNNLEIIEQETSDEAKGSRVADQLPKAGDRVLNDTVVTLAVYKLTSPTAVPTEQQGNP